MATIDGKWAFSPNEFAAKTSLHPESVRRAIRAGQIKAVKVGKRRMCIPASEVARLLNGQTDVKDVAEVPAA